MNQPKQKPNYAAQAASSQQPMLTQVEKRMSGPLPSAEEFSSYNRILPGAAERILKMAEDQQKAVFEMNKQKLVDNTANNAMIHAENMAQIKAAQWNNLSRVLSSVFVCILIIVSGVITIFKGYPNAGASIITLTIVGAIAAYVTEKVSKKDKHE